MLPLRRGFHAAYTLHCSGVASCGHRSRRVSSGTLNTETCSLRHLQLCLLGRLRMGFYKPQWPPRQWHRISTAWCGARGARCAGSRDAGSRGANKMWSGCSLWCCKVTNAGADEALWHKRCSWDLVRLKQGAYVPCESKLPFAVSITLYSPAATALLVTTWHCNHCASKPRILGPNFNTTALCKDLACNLSHGFHAALHR